MGCGEVSRVFVNLERDTFDCSKGLSGMYGVSRSRTVYTIESPLTTLKGLSKIRCPFFVESVVTRV